MILARSLNEAGIKVGMIHGGLTPRERKQQMSEYEIEHPIRYCQRFSISWY